MSEEKEVTLSLTVDDANLVLYALGNLPYNQSKTLIEKILSQGVDHEDAKLVSEVENAD